MFGAGLPVCALSYPCIQELVSPQRNGLLFSTPEELAQQLLDLFRGFPGGSEAGQQGAEGGGGLLAKLRRGAQASGAVRWHDSWQQVVLPLLKG